MARKGRHKAVGMIHDGIRRLGCQLVEVRSFDMRMPHETVIGVALIVRKDEDDVERLAQELVRWRQEKAE